MSHRVKLIVKNNLKKFKKVLDNKSYILYNIYVLKRDNLIIQIPY